MSDFIDRAEVEALADATLSQMELSEGQRYLMKSMFMAGVDAVLALLDAETTEEWGVRTRKDILKCPDERTASKLASPGQSVVSRRVLYGPWLPSEGGES